ncbi:histidinol-phosphate aminotransferase [Altererythrobacter xiamenensis]|uniref:Histidinol-phosphate aminotransferase n=1 Tax=Altererythrobacter xiamenensis TaxID=1316679 RepID=A0A1Y6F4F9_9SPHN|nr:histidinol-phosphate transaminase [Altererythrobacter xiamenensis]SMQ69667.1 histidinol-phosphate aminotransferase [Altererythrobacter xiamenensis]
MFTDRRRFLAGATFGAGLTAMPMAASTAGAAPAAEVMPFGPLSGQALLSRNENPYGPSPSAIKAINRTATMGCYYADRGLEYLQEMIAERHGVSPSQVVVGSGSTEILCAVALAWGEKGAILCPDLFWDTTVKYGERQGVKSIRVPLGPDMGVDLDAMAAAMVDAVSLVQVCNPNNPTGMLIDAAALKTFAAKVTPEATLLVDEAYNELTDTPDANSLVGLVREGKDVIICRTFSKIYGMAGMRVGYAITTEENAERIRGFLMSFGGNISGIAGAIASYSDMAFLEKSKLMVSEGRAMILDAVVAAGLTALPSQTNFVYVKVPDADKVQAAMKARNISIRGAYGPWTQYSRVSTGRIEDVARYAKALPEVIDSLFG